MQWNSFARVVLQDRRWQTWHRRCCNGKSIGFSGRQPPARHLKSHQRSWHLVCIQLHE